MQVVVDRLELCEPLPAETSAAAEEAGAALIEDGKPIARDAQPSVGEVLVGSS